MPTSPTHSAAAHWWIGACLGANLLLELLDYARADVSLRHAWPLLIGSAPNLAAVPAIAGGFASLSLSRQLPIPDGWTAHRRVVTSIAAAVVGLLLWEAAQPMTARGVFDWWDVGATLASGGLLLALHWIFGPR